VPVSGEAISDVEEDFEEESNAGSSHKVFKTTRSPYTASERAEIVEGLVKREAFGMLKGNAIWKLMEKEGVCGGRRSWQSMKEQFKKVVGPEIDSYGLDPTDLNQFRAVLGDSNLKSTKKSAEASRYPAVVNDGGSRRKTRERREPPASPSITPGGSGWMGKSSIPLPGNPRLSLKEARAESPNKRKRGKSAKQDSVQENSKDEHVSASQEEVEANGNHFYDIIPKESTPNRSLILLRKEANSVCLSPKASGSRSRDKKTPKTVVQQLSSPEPTGSVATVLERTKRRPARSGAIMESAPKKKRLRRKSKVGEVFAETPVKATSSADDTESETNLTNTDDTVLNSQEMTVVGNGVEFDSEKIVHDEIDTASPGVDGSVKKTSQGGRKRPKVSEDNKPGKKGKRSGSKRSQGKSDEEESQSSVEDEEVVEDEEGGEDGDGKKAAVVKAIRGKKADGILPRKKDRTAIGGDDEDEGEEEDWLESVKKKKSPKKNHSVKKETKVQDSGRGMFRQPYSRQEESSIVNYLLEKGGLSLTSGLKLWQDMVEAEVCPGRSAHALKEQFLHHIRKRLHEFDVTEEQLREADVRAETLTAYISHNETLGSSPSGRGFRAKANYYATEDDLKILSFILDNGRSADTGGVSLWQLMEFRKVVEGRSWQSLKERFRRSILKRLDSFGNLTADQKQRLLRGGGEDRGKGGRKKKDQRSKKISAVCTGNDEETCGIPGCKTCG